MSWEIVDPDFLGAREAETGVDLISGSDRESTPSGCGLPEILLSDRSGGSFFSSAVYAVHRIDGPEKTEILLESPESPDGLTLVRSYRFPKRGFLIELSLTWKRGLYPEQSGEATGPEYLLALGPGLGAASRRDAGLAGAMYAYVHPLVAVGSEVNRVELDPEHPEEILGGAEESIRWIGIHNRYFLMALLPAGGNLSGFEDGRAWITPAEDGDRDSASNPRIAIRVAPVPLSRGGGVTQDFTIYAGPKIGSELSRADNDLNRVLYLRLWNWLRWLCFGLLALMKSIHTLVPSWGMSIIFLAVVIRLVLSPVAQKGIRAQAQFNAANAKMRPHLKRISQEFPKDAAGKHRATMKVYKDHGVTMFSPFKGCLTLFIQIPIFIALFNVIGQAYELRGVGFLWIGDLASPDRLFPLGVTLPLLGDSFNLLPFLMALTQVLSTNLAPPDGSDIRQQRNQKWSMWAMALGFFVLFYNFPAGLIIYWTCANLGHLVQQRLWRVPVP